MTWPVALVVFGSLGALIVMSFVQWTGRWRSWYRPQDPGLSAVFATLGPSPLLVPALLGGVLVMTGLIFVSASLHIHLLIDIGIACGMAGLAIGGWIALRQPPWALPQWMREYDQLQGRHHGRYQKHQVTSAAGRLRSWSADDTFEVPMNARDALASAFRALGEVGETLHIEHATPNVLRAVVGSGVLGMNPAAVELLVEPVSDHATKVTIRATAKEGFIKQGTAEKAIKRVIEATGWIANPR